MRLIIRDAVRCHKEIFKVTDNTKHHAALRTIPRNLAYVSQRNISRPRAINPFATRTS